MTLPPDYGILDRFKCAKGSKSSHAPKVLKHYIRKQTSFNNVWTVLLKSELNGVYDLKVSPLNSLRIYPIKHSIYNKNPDLLEVYNFRVQAPECFIRSVNADSTFELFNFSKSTITNTKASIIKVPSSKLIILSRTSLIFPLHSVLVVKNHPVLSARLTLN